jgi:hypothetical protein
MLAFKQRWARVQKAQALELQGLPMPLKFKQLCFLMDSFSLIPKDRKREKETNKIRRRWLALKERSGNGL